jgi:hypothetical protein
MSYSTAWKATLPYRECLSCLLGFNDLAHVHNRYTERTRDLPIQFFDQRTKEAIL